MTEIYRLGLLRRLCSIMVIVSFASIAMADSQTSTRPSFSSPKAFQESLREYTSKAIKTGDTSSLPPECLGLPIGNGEFYRCFCKSYQTAADLLCEVQGPESRPCRMGRELADSICWLLEPLSSSPTSEATKSSKW